MKYKLYAFLLFLIFTPVQASEDQRHAIARLLASDSQDAVEAVAAQSYDELDEYMQVKIQNEVNFFKKIYFENKATRDEVRTRLERTINQLRNPGTNKDEKIATLNFVSSILYNVWGMELYDINKVEINNSHKEARHHFQRFEVRQIRKTTRPQVWCCSSSDFSRVDGYCLWPTTLSDQVVQEHIIFLQNLSTSCIESINNYEQQDIRDLAKRGIRIDQQLRETLASQEIIDRVPHTQIIKKFLPDSDENE